MCNQSGRGYFADTSTQRPLIFTTNTPGTLPVASTGPVTRNPSAAPEATIPEGTVVTAVGSWPTRVTGAAADCAQTPALINDSADANAITTVPRRFISHLSSSLDAVD